MYPTSILSAAVEIINGSGYELANGFENLLSIDSFSRHTYCSPGMLYDPV